MTAPNSALTHGVPLAASPAVRIEAARRWTKPDLSELWAYRELLYFLAWRDIKVRYRQTVLGAAWSIIQPLVVMIVFSLVFGRLAGLPSDGLPYPLFSFAALVPWMFFSNSLTQGASSVVATPDLITKVFFPRLIIPAAAPVAGLVDFAIGLVALIGIGLYYGETPGVEGLLVIPLMLLALLTALGAVFWLSALNVEYRDVKYALVFLVQLWLFATPVAYTSTMVPEPWRVLLGLNPMAGVVEGFRWALFGATNSPGPMIAVSCGACLLLLVSGVLYFRRVEDRFADVI